jgi:hypothetical protein
MEDKTVKQILINPELFNLSSSRKNKTTTRRNNNNRNNKTSNASNATTVSNTPKGKILRHIQNIYTKEKRTKKQNILQNLFNDMAENNGGNELENSIDYMLNIAKNNEAADGESEKATPMMATPMMATATPMMATPMMATATPMMATPMMATPMTMQPKYGCLKNGNLPTFTNYTKLLNNPRSAASPNKQPQKGNDLIKVQPIININTPLTNGENGLHKFLNNSTTNAEGYIKNFNNIAKKINKKKILRRTFKLGKSKKEPKVTVLISNKTIRNQVSNKMKEINQIPITDIKQFLIKKNLIRVGSTAPNDILREMYKNVMMLCGDLQNHNTENILYNYITGNKK